MGYIETNPRGVYFTDIMKSLELKSGTAVYHLRVLEREKLLVARGQGTAKLFYPFKGGKPYGEKKRFWQKANFCPSKVQQAIISTIEERPKISQADISRELVMRKDTLHYHIKKLRREGVIKVEKKGGQTFCSLEKDHTLCYGE